MQYQFERKNVADADDLPLRIIGAYDIILRFLRCGEQHLGRHSHERSEVFHASLNSSRRLVRGRFSWSPDLDLTN